MTSSDHLTVDDAIISLGELLLEKRLAIFVGAGVSIPPPSNLPTWDALLAEFIDFCDFVQQTVTSLRPEDKLDDLLQNAREHSGRYPARVASALKNRLEDIDKKYEANIAGMWTARLGDILRSHEHNAHHTSIVRTAYSYILTTNYDRLLESAAKQAGYLRLYANSYTFKDADKLGGAIYSRSPATIHVHGDLRNIALEDFVFTAEDYVKVVRQYPGFRLALQSIMMNNSVLFVGYGGSDPHLEGLLEEICYFFKYSTSELLPRFFIFLRSDKAGAVLRQYKKKLRTVLIEVDNYGETEAFLKRLQEVAPRPID